MANFDDVMYTYEKYKAGYTGNPPTTEEEYEAWIVKFPDTYDGTHPDWSEIGPKVVLEDVRRQRAEAYPPWQEQLEMQFDDKANGTTTWDDAVNAIKTKYPKP